MRSDTHLDRLLITSSEAPAVEPFYTSNHSIAVADGIDSSSQDSISNPSATGTLVGTDEVSPTPPDTDKSGKFECQYRHV